VRLYLVRGLPGSGKSELARMLTPHVYENDDYWRQDGEYVGGGARSAKAYRAAADDCWERVQMAMVKREAPIAVANCFLTLSAMERYHELARLYGYTVCVVCMQNEYGSVNGVPDADMQRMRSAWEW
jgi:predicted kinase